MTNRINHDTQLTAIGLSQANQSFNEHAPQDQDWRRDEGLGIALAHWAGWDGLQLMRVFRAALEDANFHTEAGIVEEWLAAIPMYDDEGGAADSDNGQEPESYFDQDAAAAAWEARTEVANR